MAMKILVTMLKQTAIYWGSPTRNMDGELEVAAPVEMAVRWEDVQELFTDADGKEQMSRSIVYSASDVEVDGFFKLGELTDLHAITKNPLDYSDAYKIRSFGKLPTLRADQFLRTSHLV